MYEILRKLISKKFYKTKEEAQMKVDVFYSTNRLTDEEYADLCTLIEEKYAEEVLEEQDPENIIEEDQEEANENL